LGLPAIGATGDVYVVEGTSLLSLRPDGSVRYRRSLLDLGLDDRQAHDWISADGRGMLFLRADRSLHAFRESDGMHAWTFTFDAFEIRFPVVTTAETAFVAIADARRVRLAALDRSTGSPRWEFDGEADAFEQFHRTVHAGRWEPDGYPTEHRISQVAVDDTRAFVAVHSDHLGAYTHTTFALEQTTGRVLWRLPLPGANELIASSLAPVQPPIVGPGGTLFIAEEHGTDHDHPGVRSVAYDTTVHRIDPASGGTIWSRFLPGVQVDWVEPEIDATGRLVIRAAVHHEEHQALALDPNDGSTVEAVVCDKCDLSSLAQQYEPETKRLYTTVPDGSHALCILDVVRGVCVEEIASNPGAPARGGPRRRRFASATAGSSFAASFTRTASARRRLCGKPTSSRCADSGSRTGARRRVWIL
jgi:outer membrane protein assembly factor BamB